jgi:hypothetical protein
VGLVAFLVLLVPFAPDDAAVALAGLSGLSFRWFLPLMVAGRVPGHATTALLASEWVAGSAAVWITAGIVVATALVLAFVYRERLEFWTRRRSPGRRPCTQSKPPSRRKDNEEAGGPRADGRPSVGRDRAGGRFGGADPMSRANARRGAVEE